MQLNTLFLLDVCITGIHRTGLLTDYMASLAALALSPHRVLLRDLVA